MLNLFVGNTKAIGFEKCVCERRFVGYSKSLAPPTPRKNNIEKR